ncbi:hypothetical protein KKH43_05025 [Patescibacteria group bacterium]|nr:hypothetical protein [Patescibacteria group bacterium]
MKNELIHVPREEAEKTNKPVFTGDFEAFNPLPEDIKIAIDQLPDNVQKILDMNQPEDTSVQETGGLQEMSFKEFVRILEKWEEERPWYDWKEEDIARMKENSRLPYTEHATVNWFVLINLRSQFYGVKSLEEAKKKLTGIVDVFWENRGRNEENFDMYGFDKVEAAQDELKELQSEKNQAEDKILSLVGKKSKTKPQKRKLIELEREYSDVYGYIPSQSRGTGLSPREGAQGDRMEELNKIIKEFEDQKGAFITLVHFLEYISAEDAAIIFSGTIEDELKCLEQFNINELLDAIDEWAQMHDNEGPLKKGVDQEEEMRKEKKIKLLAERLWSYVQSYEAQRERNVPEKNIDDTLKEMRVIVGLLSKVN